MFEQASKSEQIVKRVDSTYHRFGKEKRKWKDTNEVSTWQYYKHLEFLDPHMTDRTKDHRFVKDTPKIVSVVKTVVC